MIMKTIKAFLYTFLFFPLLAMGQDDFKNVYRYYDTNWLNFNALEVDKDLYVIGSGYDVNGSMRQGIYLAQVDTSGRVLMDTVVAPKVEDDIFIHEAQYDAIKTEEGFVITGQYFYRNNGVFLKVDNNFNTLIEHEYVEDPMHIHNIRNEDIISMREGYLIRATKQHDNGLLYSHLTKVSEAGELEWEETLRDKVDQKSITRLSRSKNSILNYGTIASLNRDNTPHKRYLSLLDEDGYVISDTIYELPHYSAAYVNPGYIDEDRIFLTPMHMSEDHGTGPEAEQVVAPVLQAFDHDFNMLWEYQYEDPKTSRTNGIMSIVKTQDGNYVASVNQNLPDEDPTWPNLSYAPVIHIKFTPEGEILWERRDDVLHKEDRFAFHLSSETVELSSGSIVTCGTVQYSGTESGEAAFLMKIDKDGCYNGDCSERKVYMDATRPLFSRVKSLRLAPSPASDFVTVDASIVEEDHAYVIYDMQGRWIEEGTLAAADPRIDVSHLSTGIYIVEVRSKQGLVGRGRMVVKR